MSTQIANPLDTRVLIRGEGALPAVVPVETETEHQTHLG